MKPRLAIGTDASLRRRGLLAALLALALLLPWLQQAALQHALGHARGHALHVAESTDPGQAAHTPHEGLCSTCVAFGALFATPPVASTPPCVLLATADAPFVAPLARAPAAPPRAQRNRGPPANA
jgi:hypothetical protein